eukprot:Em0012g932a
MDVSNCTTVGDAKNTLIIYSTFSTTASIFYATAVILILKTRAHRRFVHRLTLYLAISGVFSASSFLLQVIPLDVAQPDDSPASVRPGWAGMCAFGGFIVQYTGFVKTLMMLWISVYIFIVVMFQRQLSGQLKYEVSGVLVVVVTPFVLSWEPFVTDSYGISGTRCWIKDTTCDGDSKLALAYALAIVVVPQVVLTLSSLLLILVAVSSLVRKVAKRFLKQHHWLVIRDIMPLVPYPLVHSLVWLARLIDLSVGTKLRPFSIVTVVLLQSCSVILPLSLLVRSSVRSKLCRRINQIPLQSPCEDGSNYSLYEN